MMFFLQVVSKKTTSTGSSEKNEKSKAVFLGTRFHKKMVSSAFFELRTSDKFTLLPITLWRPEKLAPLVGFTEDIH